MAVQFLRERASIEPCSVPERSPYSMLSTTENGQALWDILRSLWESFAGGTQEVPSNALVRFLGPTLLCLRLLHMTANERIVNGGHQTHQWQGLLLEVMQRYKWVSLLESIESISAKYRIKVMGHESVIEHMSHYFCRTSMRLTAEFCRAEVEQIRLLVEGALAEVPVCIIYDVKALETVESHWYLLRIGMEMLKDTDYITEDECATQLAFLQGLIQQYYR